MRKAIFPIGILAFFVLYSTSCNKEHAEDRILQNQHLVENMLKKMWQDPVLKQKMSDKLIADQASYGRIIDSTLSDSTLFASLLKKIETNEDLKKRIVAQADAWKKEATKKK